MPLFMKLPGLAGYDFYQFTDFGTIRDVYFENMKCEHGKANIPMTTEAYLPGRA